jgi:RNA polymerase sigma-70 factor (ECF subfamily)
MRALTAGLTFARGGEMSDSSDPLRTTVLQRWVDQMRAGDQGAAEALVRAVGNRLERVARKMLRGYPGVARWEQTGDVLQNAVVRLLRALREVRPTSVRGFYALATEQMRRELIDLTRHYQGPLGLGAHHASVLGDLREGDSLPAVLDPPERPDDDDGLARWAAFHAAVESLPAEEREVVGLTFYHGWTQEEIATLFQVDERTVRRRWRSACLRLSEVLRGRLPELVD